MRRRVPRDRGVAAGETRRCVPPGRRLWPQQQHISFCGQPPQQYAAARADAADGETSCSVMASFEFCGRPLLLWTGGRNGRRSVESMIQ